MAFGDAEIRRSRDPTVWDRADIVFDVGERYQVGGGVWWLDHHQPGGAGCRPHPVGIPYASAGLAWKEFGAQAVTNTLEAPNDKVVASVVDRVDRGFVAPVDAADNGMDVDSDWASRYGIRPVTTSQMIGWMRPVWDEGQSEESMDNCYGAAVDWAQSMLGMAIIHAAARYRAVGEVVIAMKFRKDKRILILDRPIPWKTAVASINDPDVQFVVLPDSGSSWSVQGVRETKYGQNYKLPSRWMGLQGVAFRQATGVPDARACHHRRPICWAESREGAIALAELAASPLSVVAKSK